MELAVNPKIGKRQSKNGLNRWDTQLLISTTNVQKDMQSILLKTSGVHHQQQQELLPITANENFDNTVQFPFLFEAAIATVVGNFNRKVYQLINNSPRYNTTVFKVDLGENMFTGLTNKAAFNMDIQSKIFLTNTGILEIMILRNPESRKPNSIIMVNLISPKLEYKDYGKTSINLEPFRDAIGETLYKVCSGGGGHSGDDRPSKVSVVLEILTERKQKWYSLDTASERQKYLWTQSDGFYASRKRLIEYGYPNDEIDREYITGLIKDICENKLDVKREDIGIIATDQGAALL